MTRREIIRYAAINLAGLVMGLILAAIGGTIFFVVEFGWSLVK